MTVTILIAVFILSLVALVKGADFLLTGAERVGKYFKLPPFVIGALIVGIGTSLPELASSISAVLADTGEIVIANAVGSNIANILLVAGLSALVGRQVLGGKNKGKLTGNKIVSTKNLLNLEVPLLVISTVLFLGVAYDGTVNRGEAVLITAAFIVYLGYLLFHESDDEEEGLNIEIDGEDVKKLVPRDYFMLVGGSALLGLGANYLIDSVIQLSQIWQINPALISASAIAVGTSLPEILVSVGAVMRGRMDVAFGNVFGSNVFNMLMLVGTIGLFTNLPVDPDTLAIGLPFLAITTFIFFVSVTSRKIYVWEGLMFLIFYAFFIMKLFGLA